MSYIDLDHCLIKSSVTSGFVILVVYMSFNHRTSEVSDKFHHMFRIHGIF